MGAILALVGFAMSLGPVDAPKGRRMVVCSDYEVVGDVSTIDWTGSAERDVAVCSDGGRLAYFVDHGSFVVGTR